MNRYQIVEILEKYNNFLLKYQYVDTDIYAEEPDAIERFLETLEGVDN